jgi:hypothetical protein
MHSETLRAPTPAGSSVWMNASTSSISSTGHGQVDRQVAAISSRDSGQVAVIVERVDNRLADPDLPRVELADLELPDQVLMQIAAALVGELERTVVVALRTSFAGGERAVLPRIHVDDDFFLGVARGGSFSSSGRLLVRWSSEVSSTPRLPRRHDVGFERLHLRLGSSTVAAPIAAQLRHVNCWRV